MNIEDEIEDYMSRVKEGYCAHAYTSYYLLKRKDYDDCRLCNKPYNNFDCEGFVILSDLKQEEIEVLIKTLNSHKKSNPNLETFIY